MNDQLTNYALMAWTAFEEQDYPTLERYGAILYNHFVHNPTDILNLKNPLLVGKVFQACLGFEEPDYDVQEVKAENAFLCFSQSLNSDCSGVHDEACARMMILLIREMKYLKNKVEQSCSGNCANPYSILALLNDGMPNDMPMAANTKMLFTAYYLYTEMLNKDCVANEFVIPNEKQLFEQVKYHVIYNCNQIARTSNTRTAQLGKIVYDKVCEQLRKDIQSYSGSM